MQQQNWTAKDRFTVIKVKLPIKVLDWPGNSPSLKPIENLWSIVKIRLLKRDGTSETKLIDAIIDVWCYNLEITQNCEKLVESMPKRVLELITDRGGRISNHK